MREKGNHSHALRRGQVLVFVGKLAILVSLLSSSSHGNEWLALTQETIDKKSRNNVPIVNLVNQSLALTQSPKRIGSHNPFRIGNPVRYRQLLVFLPSFLPSFLLFLPSLISSSSIPFLRLKDSAGLGDRLLSRSLLVDPLCENFLVVSSHPHHPD